MNPVDLLKRAARKPPGYLIRRVLREARKFARARKLRRELANLTAAKVARSLGAPSLASFWQQISGAGFLYSASEREQLHCLYLGSYSLEANALKQAVERILAHEFELLGSGPTLLGPDIDWNQDFKSGRRWDLQPAGKIDYAELDRPSDVKVPWELSRGHHLVTLGQAWTVFRDERAAHEFEREIRSWIRSNPAGYGVNWAVTMEVALRAVNWIWAVALFADAPLSVDFWETILSALYQHGLWIPEHLEVSHINGNHYVANALGLVACGALFGESPQGNRWLDQGARILEEEILLQVEEDGVDIEGSVPYHRLVLEIFLVGARLMRSAGRSPSQGYRNNLEQMIEFVDAYTTMEGSSPVIGDADDGRVLVFGKTSPTNHRYLLSSGSVLFGRSAWMTRAGKYWEDSLWLLGPGLHPAFEKTRDREEEFAREFPASGFFVLRAPAHYLFVDAGPVGFRGLGGHGHNDCLSFEWHAAGRPLLTDSGLFVYTASPEWRDRFRATAFHNTIQVDGEEINRFLSPRTLWFLGNDAQPLDVRFQRGEDKDLLSAGHTGYRRLKDPVTVCRAFEFDRRQPAIRLVDRLDGAEEHLVEIFFHAAPGAIYHSTGQEMAEFKWPDGLRVRLAHNCGPKVRLEEREGWFAPSYGVKVARPVCVASTRSKLPLEIVWDLTIHIPGQRSGIAGE